MLVGSQLKPMTKLLRVASQAFADTVIAIFAVRHPACEGR